MAAAVSMPTMLTRDDVAAALQVSVDHVDRLIRRRVMRAVRLGRSVRIPRAALADLEARGGAPTATRKRRGRR